MAFRANGPIVCLAQAEGRQKAWVLFGAEDREDQRSGRLCLGGLLRGVGKTLVRFGTPASFALASQWHTRSHQTTGPLALTDLTCLFTQAFSRG